MNYQSKLYSLKNLYNHKTSDEIFIKAVKQNVMYHKKHCLEYAYILKDKRFHIKQLNNISDLSKLPAIPTLYLKLHNLKSIDDRKMLIKATSSGTKGKKSSIGFDMKGLLYGFRMVMKVASFHKLLSWKPTNYIVLGYEPNKNNKTVVSKTAFGATLFAPAIKREFALKYINNNYQLDFKSLARTLIRYSHQPFPVRLIGFPAYTYFFLNELKKAGVSVKLPKDSMVMLGGGWKQFYSEKVEKEELYKLIEDTLGIKKSNCREFFGAVEHPIIYCDCKNHHFHVPAYSRVIIRDVVTLLPVEKGKIGLLNLITPMLNSMPVVSVMTDDLAILHDGSECGCGIDTPYFEIIGRVGVEEIKTCAAGADELLQGKGES
jgi:phenylacetate-coenzyme A ligase PaaK-like adenylate-forming protein